MTERDMVLGRLLSQLEVDKAGIEHAIHEIQRRFALLDEVESWGLLVMEEPSSESPTEDSRSGDIRYDGFENQDNYRDSEEAFSYVAAGYF